MRRAVPPTPGPPVAFALAMRWSAVVAVVGSLGAAWALLLPTLACCSARTVLQGATMPLSEPAPPPTSHGRGDLYAAVSGLTSVSPTNESNVGHYVPAAQLAFAASFRPVSGLTLRPLGTVALSQGATPLDPDLIAPATDPSFSLGLDVGYVYGTERTPYLIRPHLGAGAVGIEMRIEDPAGGVSITDTGWMMVVQAGLDAGYWVTPWLLILGAVDVRNAPRVPATTTACYGDDPPYVNWGAFALNVRVSAEIELGHAVGIVAAVSVPAMGNPYEPYPILTLGLRGILGEAPARQRFERNEGGRLVPAAEPARPAAESASTEDVLGALGARGG